MKHVNKSVLVWYSAQEMFDLVVDVPAYPQFLPWCDQAQVVQHHSDGMTARLGLAFGRLRHTFTTRNTHVQPHEVGMSLVDGPFSHLEGHWHFADLHPDGSNSRACRATLDLRYAFEGRTAELVLSPVFDRIAATLVDAFLARAQAVYGSR